MIKKLSTTEGLIYAYIEYNRVDSTDRLDKLGNYVSVGHCWVNDKVRHKGILKELTTLMFEDTVINTDKPAEFVIWQRENGKQSGVIPISKCIRYTKYKDIKQE